ncbi:MAG: hypothetical protein R3D63_10965 [Paracoccaceae bacterium]
MSEPGPVPDFSSGEDFAALMAGLAGRLHAKNRIWLGESGYAWQVAQLLTAVGVDFRDALADPEVTRDFGDAYAEARLGRAEQVDALLARLRARLLP